MVSLQILLQLQQPRLRISQHMLMLEGITMVKSNLISSGLIYVKS
jgi:hypothetical protein